MTENFSSQGIPGRHGISFDIRKMGQGLEGRILSELTLEQSDKMLKFRQLRIESGE